MKENLRKHANPDVRLVVSSGARLDAIASESLDSVFASNVYEHFPSREDVALSFAEVFRVLRPAGRFVIMQPNFAHCAKKYFGFFDHRLIFTHLGMQKGLEIAGFRENTNISRFLPYTSNRACRKLPGWSICIFTSPWSGGFSAIRCSWWPTSTSHVGAAEMPRLRAGRDEAWSLGPTGSRGPGGEVRT